MEVMILPNLVNLAPGIQVIKIDMRQRIVYMIITAERIDKIAPTIAATPIPATLLLQRQWT